MRKSRIAFLKSSALPLLLALLAPLLDYASPSGDEGGNTDRNYRIPALFTSNAGQWDSPIRFAIQEGKDNAIFFRDGFTLLRRRNALPAGLKFGFREGPQLHASERSVFPVKFAHTRADAEILPGWEAVTQKNFYLGSKPERWREKVPTYRSLLYHNLWNSIDVAVNEASGKLRQTFIMAPGAKLDDIEFETDKDASLPRDSRGALHLKDRGEEIALRIVNAWQVDGRDTVRLHAEFREKKGAAYGIDCGNYRSVLPLFIETEFSTFFGGSGYDSPGSIAVDSDGNAYVCGATDSDDFPVVNAFQNAYAGDVDVFISKFSCDGQELLFSSYFGGKESAYPYYSRAWDWPIRLFARNGQIYLTGDTECLDFPVTTDALEYHTVSRSHGNTCFIARFSYDGHLKYSTYFGGEGCEYYPRSAAMDDSDNLYLLFKIAHSSENGKECLFPYITPDAYNSTYSDTSSTAAIIAKLTPDCKSVLYGTYVHNLFAPRHHADFYPDDIAVDHSNEIVITGTTNAIMPAVNAFQDALQGFEDAYLFKLNPLTKNIVFSTYIGGGEIDDGLRLSIDKRNNVYLLCESEGHMFPIRNVTPFPYAGSVFNFTISKFSPHGDLLFSNYLGTIAESYWSERSSMLVDDCENMYIQSTYRFKSAGGDPGFPFALPRIQYEPSGSDFIDYLSVLDSAGSFYRYASHWAKNRLFSRNLIDGFSAQALALMENYVYILNYGNNILPTYKPWQPQSKDTVADAYITKVYLPVCTRITSAVRSLDSIRIETGHAKISPDRFVVTANIFNGDSIIVMDSVTVELFLPAGLSLDSTEQKKKSLVPFTLPPQATGSINWIVHVDSIGQADSCLAIAIRVRYRRSDRMTNPCFVDYSESGKIVLVKRYEERLNLACALETIDSLALNASGTGLLPDPIPVSYTLRNTDQRLAKMQTVYLILPPGMATIPPGDTRRSVAFIPAGDSVRLTWLVSAPGPRFAKEIRFIVVALDTNGWEQSRCEKTIIAPGIPVEVTCDAGNYALAFEKTKGIYLPDPLRVVFYLQNHIDTMQTRIDVELVMDRAPHLDFAPGEVQKKLWPLIPAYGREPIAWNLRLRNNSPFLEEHLDTLVFRWRTEYDTTWRMCEAIVRIEKADISMLLSCTLSTPDTLRADGDTLAGNPMRIGFSAKNIGLLPAQLKEITLQPFGDPRIASLDPPVIPAGTLAVGDSLAASWRVQLKTSRFAREHTAEVIVTDTSGAVVLMCEKKFTVEPIVPSMSCSVSGADTLRFNKASQKYEPDPFPLLLTLANKLDTAQANIEAAIDLSITGHLALNTGGTPVIQFPLIAEHASAQASWNLTVSSNAQQDITDTVILRFRLSPAEPWQECRHLIFIEAEKKIARAGCAAAGPDTIWNVRERERLAPNPVLVRYTLSNTGTMTLSNCQVAILLSGLFTVAAGTDSVQAFGPIPWGKSETHEWLLDVVPKYGIDTSVAIRWQWSCAELAEDTSCEHRVIFTTKDPKALIVTPWVVHFRAKQNDPLPPAQSVSLLTPTIAALAWQASTALPWLDIQPASGDYPASIALRPNTTALPIGMYTGGVTFTPASPYLSTGVQVEYEIYTITGIERKESAESFLLDQNYPNPFAGETSITFHLSSPAKVTLKLYDLFGRELAAPVEEEREAGRHVIRIHAEGMNLLPGIYIYALSANGRTVARRMAVVR